MCSTAASFIVLVFVTYFSSQVKYSEGWFFFSSRTNCYRQHSLGCFPTSYPFNNAGGIAPQGPDALGVLFHFYPGSQDKKTVSLDSAEQRLANTYDPTKKTVVIIHGYFEDLNRAWIRQMVDKLLIKGERNVVVVDWNEGANNILYHQSVANTRMVGAIVAVFLQKLMDLGGDPSSFHVVGFSLGAHVAGYTGSRLRGIGRITGLDPARPNFEGYPAETRLDPSDAIFVDVIHTNGASSATSLGARQPMGTVDFYPNGGDYQPGCARSMIDRVSAVVASFDFSANSARLAFGCSHTRATSIFSASINNNCTRNVRHCASLAQLNRGQCSGCTGNACPVMGYNLDPSNIGEEFRLLTMETSGRWPYC